MELLQQNTIELLSIVLGGVITIVAAYVGLFVAKITQKTRIEMFKLEDEKVRAMFNDALSGMESLIQTNIVAMENTVKKELLEKALIDGKVDKEELKQLAIEVKSNVLNQLSDGTIDVLNNGIKDLGQYLDAKIEQELAEIKKTEI